MELTWAVMQLVWNSSADPDLKGICCRDILFCVAAAAHGQAKVPACIVNCLYCSISAVLMTSV